MGREELKEIEVKIVELLSAVYLAGTENGLNRTISDPVEIIHRREAFIENNPVRKEASKILLELFEEYAKEIIGEDDTYPKLPTTQEAEQKMWKGKERNGTRYGSYWY